MKHHICVNSYHLLLRPAALLLEGGGIMNHDVKGIQTYLCRKDTKCHGGANETPYL